MKANTETTKFDRLRMAIGTTLAVGGVLALIFAGTMFGFTNLPLTFSGILFVVSGLFIAGSTKLAELIVDLLR